MKIRFLGTGAADWKRKPEEEMLPGERRYTSNLVDGKILVDIAPQSYAHAVKLGIDMTAITDVIISHTHGDHYSKDSLLSFAKASGNVLNVWCHKDALSRLSLEGDEQKLVEIHPLEVMDTFSVGDCKITALAANHLVEKSDEIPLHYIFEGNGKALFYGCDGGWFTARTWEYMRLNKFCFDGMILDATVGDKDGDFRLGTHNSIPMLRLIVAALDESKMIHSDTKLIASHLAKTLHAGEDETKKLFAEMGMSVAFDGDELEI